jgi:hypothetical protein
MEGSAAADMCNAAAFEDWWRPTPKAEVLLMSTSARKDCVENFIVVLLNERSYEDTDNVENVFLTFSFVAFRERNGARVRSYAWREKNQLNFNMLVLSSRWNSYVAFGIETQV